MVHQQLKEWNHIHGTLMLSLQMDTGTCVIMLGLINVSINFVRTDFALTNETYVSNAEFC